MELSLLSCPSNSPSAAFLFWFLLWFACILAFSFELRVDVASLELTFGCFDCFVQQLFPLLYCRLLLFLLPAEVPEPKLKFRWLGSLSANLLKTDISSSKSVNSNEIVESSSQPEQSLKIKPIPLFTKSLSSMKRTTTQDAIISWQRWIKVCGPLGKPISD